MHSSILITAIGAYVPSGRVDNHERARSFGYETSFVDQKIGARTLSRKEDGEETSDLAVQAVRDLAAQGIDVETADAFILCTQNPDGYGIPHTSAVVHGKLGLPKHCAAFDISLGCSGYVYGLAIASGFMNAQGFENAILVTSDPYSKIVDPANKDTALLFGDAATASWLQREAPGRSGFRIGPAAFGTDGRSGHHLMTQSDRHLSMNGREVFNFSATEVPRQITGLLERCGLADEQINYYILHQGSKYIVETIQKRMKIPPNKVPVRLSETGNTVSSSIPLILRELLPSDAATRVVLSGFGVGLSFATMIVEWVP